MSFQTPFFFAFFLLFFLAYQVVPQRFRWSVLLVSSLGFYLGLGAIHLLIPLVVVTLSSYWVGIRIHGAESKTKRAWLVTGIAVNILMLVFFRLYSNAVKMLVGIEWVQPGIFPQVLAAFGVSYYVFQAISYLADVHLGKIEAERHLGIFAVYLSFFPKILQGPIERGKDLLPQLQQLNGFSYENARAGALRFTYGLFKKVVVADRLGVIVDPIYGGVHEYSGVALLFATVVYAFQLYYDFSGYTDMALGVAQVFNIKLTDNFNLPYLATSITEFWRRWHISFSRWIMDYLFKPIQLGLRRHGKLGVVIALMVTFFLSGLWHGITWGYVVWGLLHGVYLSVSMLYAPYRKKLYKRLKLDQSRLAKAWQVLLTFCLVDFSFIFFRAKTIQDAAYIVQKLLPWNWLTPSELICTKLTGKQFIMTALGGKNPFQVFGMIQDETCQVFFKQFVILPGQFQWLNIGILTIGVLELILFFVYGRRIDLTSRPPVVRWIIYICLVVFIFAAGLFLQIPDPSGFPYLYANY